MGGQANATKEDLQVLQKKMGEERIKFNAYSHHIRSHCNALLFPFSIR